MSDESGDRAGAIGELRDLVAHAVHLASTVPGGVGPIRADLRRVEAAIIRAHQQANQ